MHIVAKTFEIYFLAKISSKKNYSKQLKLELEKKTLRTVLIVQLQSIVDISLESGRLTGEFTTLSDREESACLRGFEEPEGF